MLEIINKEECCGCNACSNICPKQCITMQPDYEGFWYPQIDIDYCLNCDICKRVCPILNSSEKSNENIPTAYAAINKNDQVRLNSSSGGFFTLLAEEIITQGGVVFGATMSEDCHGVEHISVERLDELWKLQGSKYSQSWIGDTYLQVKEQLVNGRKVLFSGTPCQVEGLKAFLNKDYNNLLSVDFICHGVPSPNVWNKYVSYREKYADSSLRRTSFRHKKYGWKTFSILLEFSNNTEYEQIFSKDLFMQSFLRNSCLRPSCHSCNFKKINRVSDITMADFWGVHGIAPEMDDDKGTSLILIHSKKGINAFKQIEEFMKIIPVDVSAALKENSAMIQSAVPNRNRAEYFSNLDNIEFEELVTRYAKQKFSIRSFVVELLKKVGVLNKIKKLKSK